ncbi:alpha/beta fold hydrolase [Cellulomonas soli]|uniref:alpha/beta fold hydrolase n=1 Tax=Cellulomonas soli TaxID=931535 RepID=UPI003F87A3EB
MSDQVVVGVDAAPVPVVLLHGITDDGGCWPGVVAHLQAAGHGRHVVTPSALWHGGRTGEGRTALTIGTLAADAAATIAATLSRPAVVVGHSMGGVTAEEVALIAPELVAALVLVDPAWMGDDPADDGAAPAWLRSFAGTFEAAPQAGLEAWSRTENPGWPDDEHAPWAASKKALDLEITRVPHVWGERDWPAALAGVAEARIPVTLVTGDRSAGAIVDEAMVATATAALGRAGRDEGGLLTHVALAATGHNVHRDDRPGFLRVLDEALARADAAAV